MKKILLLIFLICFIACNSNNDPDYPRNTDAYLFVRDDAGTTTIPLILGKSWNFRVDEGGEEKPAAQQIRNLLRNDEIIEMKILPVRAYDNNSGSGRYQYKALCYITENHTVFFYMNDRIYVGRYLMFDHFGLESVTWDFELPTHYTESSARLFTLNRNVNITDPNVNLNENALREVAGLHSIYITRNDGLIQPYHNCKLFQFDNKSSNPSEIRTNYFYFKNGVGLVKYQLILKVGDETVILYEQVLIEP